MNLYDYYQKVKLGGVLPDAEEVSPRLPTEALKLLREAADPVAHLKLLLGHDIQLGRQRLALLRDLLSEIPSTQIDLQEWECGTAACAVGWACRMESFPELTMPEETPKYLGLNHFPAVMAYFSLDYHEAINLFSVDSYPRRKGVKRELLRRMGEFLC